MAARIVNHFMPEEEGIHFGTVAEAKAALVIPASRLLLTVGAGCRFVKAPIKTRHNATNQITLLNICSSSVLSRSAGTPSAPLRQVVDDDPAGPLDIVHDLHKIS